MVRAILLKHDGSAIALHLNYSSKNTRELLGGRPSIVGEIEDLNVVVIQSLDISPDDSLNRHTLPLPLCNNQTHGDYVLFRVDSAAKAGDLTLAEYQEYVDDHKALTDEAVKQNKVDHSLPMRLPSSFKSISG